MSRGARDRGFVGRGVYTAPPWPVGQALKPLGKIEVGDFTGSGSTGDQDITIATDLTGAASGSWALMFFSCVNGAPASGTFAASARPMIGFVANGGGTISEFAVCNLMVDGSAPDTQRRMAAKAITTVGGAQETAAEASFVSFPTSTTMRINWTTAGSSQKFIYILLYGLTGAKVVQWDIPLTAIDKAVTGVGFNPDLVLTATNQLNGTASGGTSMMSLGVMNKHGQQWSTAIVSNDTATSQTARFQETDSCTAATYADATAEYIYWQAHFKSMDSDGFTVNFSTVTGGANKFISLCLDGISSKIGAFTKSAAGAPTTQTVDARQGFVPRGAIFSTVNALSEAGPSAAANWSVGLTDGTNERAMALVDRDNVSTAEVDSVWRSDKAIATANNNPAIDALADVTVTASESFDVSLTTNDGSLREVCYLLLGDAGVDTFPAKVLV